MFLPARAEAIHLKRRVAALHGAGDGTDDEVKKQEFMKLAAEQRAKDEGEAGRSGDGLAATRNKARGNKASNKKGWCISYFLHMKKP